MDIKGKLKLLGYYANFLHRQSARKIYGQLEKPDAMSSGILASGAGGLNKVIWMYWDSGLEGAPDLVQASCLSWSRANPGWQVRFLDKAQAQALAQLPEFIERKPMSKQHYADIVRLALLHRFGGVWADATTFCARPLDDWLPAAMPTGFFAFSRDVRDGAANWFMAADAGNPVASSWLKVVIDFWSVGDRATSYMMYYDLFFLALRDRDAARAWKYASKFDRLLPTLVRRFKLDRDKTEAFRSLCGQGRVPVHKLSSRDEIPEEFSGTPLEVVLGFGSLEQLRQALAANADVLQAASA